jgi:hypothetical protein
MTPAEKQKEIAVAFARYFNHEVSKVSHITSRLLIILYENWLLTEEGKRLTAEDPVHETESSLETLEKISAYVCQVFDSQIDINQKLDRMEGRMDKMNGNLFAE